MTFDSQGARSIPAVRVDPPPPQVEAPRPSGAANSAAASKALSRRDFFAHDDALGPVADLLLNAGASTPLSAGLFAGPGAGKSAAVDRLAARLATADTAAGAGARPLIVRLSAGNFGAEPEIAVAEALRAALVEAGAAPLAAEAAHAATDPHTAARDLGERLDATRDRLDTERKALDEVEGRKARLLDAVLYETAGSSIDAHARFNRGAIDARLRGFGFQGDPVANFKDLARDAAERPGLASRLVAFVHAMWAYKGQFALLAWAVIVYGVGLACEMARDNSDAWLAALRGLGDNARPIADFAAARLDWLDSARALAGPAALVLIALAVLRALRFLFPVWRGARLLETDVATRRNQLETAIGHQVRRVDTLSRDVEALSDAAAIARARADGRAGLPGMAVPLSTTAETPEGRARAFVTHVAAAVSGGAPNAPRRIVALIDDVEALPPARAVEALAACRRLLALDGVATIFAADPARLTTALQGPAAAAEWFDRLIDVPVNLPDADRDSDRMSTYARALLNGHRAPATAAPVAAAARPPLDTPPTTAETELVAALAPIAARTPRGAARYVTLYRLARGRAADPAALALMLALDLGATAGELAAVGAALDGPPENAVAIGPDNARLAFALARANEDRGTPLTIADARAAWSVARDYRMPL